MTHAIKSICEPICYPIFDQSLRLYTKQEDILITLIIYYETFLSRIRVILYTSVF